MPQPEEMPQMLQEEEGPVNKLFSFVKEGEQMVKQELDSLMQSVKLDEKDVLIRALHRGIGLHHPGLPKKYRQVRQAVFLFFNFSFFKNKPLEQTKVGAFPLSRLSRFYLGPNTSRL